MTLLNELKNQRISLDRLYSKYTEDDFIEVLNKVSGSKKSYSEFEGNTIYINNMLSLIENVYLRRYLRRVNAMKSNTHPLSKNVSMLVTYLSNLEDTNNAVYK